MLALESHTATSSPIMSILKSLFRRRPCKPALGLAPLQEPLFNLLDEPLTGLERHHASIEATHRRLDDFLVFVQTCINLQSFPTETQESLAPDYVFHSSGFIQRALTPKQTIPRSMIDAWIKDTEHGLLHGLSVAFFALLVTNKSGIRYSEENEKLLASCLLHDFLRCSEVHDRHDEQLELWFSSLDPATYSHSKPTEEQASHPLVIGDRIELLRYSDHREWVNASTLEQRLEGPELKHVVVAYYRFIRPALEIIFRNWDGVWLRHSRERERVMHVFDTNDDGCSDPCERGKPGMYPHFYWAPSKNYWSIEVGKAPFELNLGRDMYNYSPMMLLGLERYFELGGRPLKPFMDHLSASADIPAEEWIGLLMPDDLKDPDNESTLMSSAGFLNLSTAKTVFRLSDYLIAFLQSVKDRGTAADPS